MKSDSETTIYEIMQSYCVRVNGGSGVLVNAMTIEYSYVLTAAHVIKDYLNMRLLILKFCVRISEFFIRLS